MTVPCAHCGLPAPEPATGEDPAFCCPGCQAVYYALQHTGLEDFYDIRARISPDKARPASQNAAINADRFALDSFINEQTTLLSNGHRSVELHLEGVHCAGCVWLVEKMPSVLKGVEASSLNLGRARLKVQWDPEEIPLSEIAKWLGQFGYTAVPLDAARTNLLADTEKKLLYRMGVAWAVAGNVMMLAATLYSGLNIDDGPLFHFARILSGLLTLISIVYCAPVFFRRALGSIRPWAGWTRLSIDVPISIGIIVGFTHSVITTITGVGEVWYDSVSVLIAALLTARWLQTRGRRLAGDAAERLITVMPVTAKRIEPDGTVTDLHAEKLSIGDTVLVQLGEIIPADGLIIEGETTLERAVLTGESRPEPVYVGDPVNASEVNVGNPIKVRVTAIGEDTRVGRLLNWIQESSGRRAEVVHLADAISGYFVGGILLAAGITAVVWFFLTSFSQALEHSVALLVVCCPCALGMATPLAMTMGMGRASKAGIFVKHEDVVELIRKADLLILDKTGTVTYGKMKVDAAHLPQSLLADIAALERISNHPIAHGFKPYDDGRMIEHAEEIAGQGIAGSVSGHHYRIGSPSWIAIPDEDITQITGRGLTPVVIEQDGEYVGVLGVGDEIREEGRDVMTRLMRRGVAVRILSGDHPTLVENAAQALGLLEQAPLANIVDERLQTVALGGQTPDQKLALVEAYRDAGLTVVMVGDGVNDAGALKVADVGIAVEGGSDINQIAGDVFLTRTGLYPIEDLWYGCDQIMHIVKRNLVGSLAYNFLGISAAALGLVSPLLAAIAMPVSSLSVVASSMIGKRWNRGENGE